MSSDVISTVYGLLPANLQTARLADLCEAGGVQTGPFGSQLHQEDYVEDGTPIITVEHLGENRILHTSLPRVSDVDKARLEKYVLRSGDIVFSRVGSVDRRALVQNREDGWLFSGRCLRVRPNSEVLNSCWLSYFFGLPAFKGYIRGIAVGATMPSLNTKILSDVPIYFPSLNIQHSAAQFLASIDDRITLLRETNTTLEAIAQALFKSWFVDFDPVRAKQEGRTPEGMDEATAALFPDGFEASELGAVPRGWSISTLGNICDTHSGAIQTGPFGSQLHASDYVSDGIPVVMPKDISGRRINSETAARIRSEDAERLSRHQVQEGDIVFSRRGDVEKHALIGRDERGWLCGTGCLLVRPGSRWCSPGFLSRALELAQTKRWLTQHAVGATMPNLNTGILAAVPVLLPESKVLSTFEEIASVLEQRISESNATVQTLAAIRDTLLPRLISGQLRLPEAEAILETAA